MHYLQAEISSCSCNDDEMAERTQLLHEVLDVPNAQRLLPCSELCCCCC